MTVLQAEAMSVRYDKVDIVKQLHLSIPAGQITTIIGPNGCGKSTILKTMARILKLQVALYTLMEKRFIGNRRNKLRKKWRCCRNPQKRLRV